MEEQSKYTSEDLIRYLKDEMTDHERHLLEKAALDDPFLQDALDGLQNLSAEELEVELEKLKRQLDEKTKLRSGYLWPQKMGIAASLLIGMAIATYLIINFDNFVSTEDSLAHQEQKGEVEEVEDDSDDISKDYSSQETLKKPVESQEEMEESPPVDEKTNQPQVASKSSAGEMVAIEEEPEPVQEIQEKELTDVAPDDAVDVEDLEDEFVQLDVAILEEEEMVENAAPEVLALKKEDATLRSPAAGSGQRLSMAGKRAPNRPGKEPIPVNGYETLYSHIEKNKSQSFDKQEFALIEFVVKTDSKLTNFKVLEESREGLGKEAIDLVKDGPNWFPAIEEGVAVKKTVELKVEF